MNSSTSSFRNELRVVACVIVALLLTEAVMRLTERRLSTDIDLIRSGEEIGRRIGAAGGDRTVLILGNSLSRDGLDRRMLAAAAGPGTRIEAYYPDGSSVSEWAYAYRKHFVHPGHHPDFLIIGAGRSHLFDSDLPADRFGAYFCDNRDLLRYFRRHVSDLDDASSFILARLSVAYASRGRVQPRVFTAIIPHYQATLRLLATKPAAAASRTRIPTHRNLGELLEDAVAAGTRVAVVCIPMPEPYDVPEETLQVVRRSGARFIDARSIAGIRRRHFPDDYHLNEEGAAILTGHVAGELSQAWWSEAAHEAPGGR